MLICLTSSVFFNSISVVWSLSHIRIFCEPMDHNLLVSFPSSFPGTSQARILEWVAISFSRGSSWSRVEPPSPALAGRFLTTEPLGKPSSISTSMQSKKAMCFSITEKIEEQKLKFLQIVTVCFLSFTIVIKEIMIFIFFWVCWSQFERS